MIIGDPAKGIEVWSYEELEKRWLSKKLLLFSKNEDFQKNSVLNKQKKRLLLDLLKPDLGVLTIVFILGVLITVLGFSLAVFNQKLIDQLLPNYNSKSLYLAFIALFILLLIRLFVSYLKSLFISRQRLDFNNRLLDNFISGIMELPYRLINNISTGDILGRLNDSRRIQAVLSYIFSSFLIDLILILLTISLIGIFYSEEIALFIIITLPIFIVIILFYQSTIIKDQKEVMESYALSESQYLENVQGWYPIIVANRQSFFINKANHVFSNFQSKSFDLSLTGIKFSSASEMVSIFLTTGILAIGSYLFFNKNLKIGELIAVITLAVQVLPATLRLLDGCFKIQEGKVAFDRIFEILTMIEPKQTEYRDFHFKYAPTINISSVTFKFPGQLPIFKDANLKAIPGKLTILIGENGCGKSTLLQLIQNFIKPVTGHIFFDNVNVGEISNQQMHKIVSIVPHSVFLFRGDVFENITLSKNKDDHLKALSLCTALDLMNVIDGLPQGINTMLGSGGTTISEGQSKIIGLLRALFNEPKVLLLDEPIANLNNNLQKKVISILNNLKNEINIVIITHQHTLIDDSCEVFQISNEQIERYEPQLIAY